MTATSKGAVCPCLDRTGEVLNVPDVSRVLPAVAVRAVCVCGACIVECCAAWWRMAITRLVTRYKTLHYIIICGAPCISSPC